MEVLPAAEVSYTLHPARREILGPRPPLPARAESAVDRFADVGEAIRYHAWLADGCQRGGREVASDGFWVGLEVNVMRDRAIMAGWRRTVRRYAARNDVYEPPPPNIDAGPSAPGDAAAMLAYGRQCREVLLAKGAEVKAKSDRELAALGRRAWHAWARILRLRPPPTEAIARSYCRQIRDGALWSLVADRRPILLSTRTAGRPILLDGHRRLLAHAAVGRRSPGVNVLQTSYADLAEEREAIVTANAASPALAAVDRVRIAECLRPAYRRKAARNSGRPAGEFRDLSGTLPRVGRRGARLKRRPAARAVRVNERLAAAAAMSVNTYERHLRRLRGGGPKAAVPPPPAAA